MRLILETVQIHRILKMVFRIYISAMVFLSGLVTAYAHGVVAGYSKQTGIVVTAHYDSGQPMSNAQVSVFSPDNPAKPWLTSTLDEDGRFSFVPDASVPGTWSVQVRQVGHGAMIHIPLDESTAQIQETGAASLNPLQRIVIAACVVWGSIGTALYFSRKRKTRT